MASYRDMLKAVKSRIREVDVRQLDASRNGSGKPVVIDIREQDEVEQGIIPGAIHIPRGYLESRVEQYVPDVGTPVVAYCAGGSRSAFAAETLQQMGYKDVDRKSTRLNSSHSSISYAVFCLKKKKKTK